VTSRLARTTILVLLNVARTADAAPAAQVFKWDELQKQGRILAGTVVGPDRGSSELGLKVASASTNPTSATVLQIENPQITAPRYHITGKVRYQNVEGTGYLEMWSYFPGGGQYFSRTLADQGPMMKLQGSSEWRPFVLPFDATGAPAPTRLVVNVFLQGRGTVYLGPLELSEESGTGPGTRGDAGRVIGLAGGIAGAVIGCLGALIGVLTSLGRARRFVIASTTSLIVLGTLAFTASVVALTSVRSYPGAYRALLLFGFLSSVVPLALLPAIRKRYEGIELRTMRAHDLRRR
jgi:hypothetical protein